MAGISKARLNRIITDHQEGRAKEQVEQTDRILLAYLDNSPQAHFIDNTVNLLSIGAFRTVTAMAQTYKAGSFLPFWGYNNSIRSAAKYFWMGGRAHQVRILSRHLNNEQLTEALQAPVFRIRDDEEEDDIIHHYLSSVESAVKFGFDATALEERLAILDEQFLPHIASGGISFNLTAHPSLERLIYSVTHSLYANHKKSKNAPPSVAADRFPDDHLLHDLDAALINKPLPLGNLAVFDAYLLKHFMAGVFDRKYLPYVIACPNLIESKVFEYAMHQDLDVNNGRIETPLSELLKYSAQSSTPETIRDAEHARLRSFDALVQKGLSAKQTQAIFLSRGSNFKSELYLDNSHFPIQLFEENTSLFDRMMSEGFFGIINPYKPPLFGAESLITDPHSASLKLKPAVAQFKAATANPTLAALPSTRRGLLSMVGYISKRASKEQFPIIKNVLTHFGLNLENVTADKKSLLKALFNSNLFAQDRKAKTLDQYNLIFCLIDNFDIDAIKIAVECGHDPNRPIAFDGENFTGLARFMDTPDSKLTLSKLVVSENRSTMNDIMQRNILERKDKRGITPLQLLSDFAFKFEDDYANKRKNNPKSTPAYVRVFSLLLKTTPNIDKPLSESIAGSPYLTAAAFINKAQLSLTPPVAIDLDQDWDPSYSKWTPSRLSGTMTKLLTTLIKSGHGLEDIVTEGNENISDILEDYCSEDSRAEVMHAYLEQHEPTPRRRRATL